MNKMILIAALLVSSFGFAKKNDEKEKKPSTLVCKTRDKTTVEGEVGAVTMTADSSENIELVVEVVTDKITNSEIRYEQHKSDLVLGDLPEGFTENKMISFKRVSSSSPIVTEGYFVYIKKGFPSSYKITVVDKTTGEMKVLPKCYYSDKFITKLIKL